MKVLLLESAINDLIDAINYYDEQLLGLGDQFLVQFQKTKRMIECYPDGWQIIK